MSGNFKCIFKFEEIENSEISNFKWFHDEIQSPGAKQIICGPADPRVLSLASADQPILECSAWHWKFPNLQSPPNDLRENSIVFGAKPGTTTMGTPQETTKPSQRHSDIFSKEPNLRGFYFLVKPYLLLGDVREFWSLQFFQAVLLKIFIKSMMIWFQWLY